MLDCVHILNSLLESNRMGKGDRRSRRGKIYRGSFGKTRPKDPAAKSKKKSAPKR